jgi:hypothetical protein
MASFFLTSATKGRRIVLWTFACFLLSQVALSLYLDYKRPELRDPLYGYRLRSLQSRLAASPDAPLFLLLGSSRIKYSVCPDAMQIHATEAGSQPIIYNFGINGMGTIRELMYMRRLLADGIRPKWLLLELWPPLWAESGFFRESRMVLGEDDLHWRDLPLVLRYFRGEREILRVGLRKSVLPVSDYRSRLLEATVRGLVPLEQMRDIKRHMSDWVPADALGWYPLPWGANTPQDRHRAIEHGEEEMKPLVDPLVIDPRSDSALRELLTDCRKHQIKVAIILMPEHSRTRSWYPPQARSVMREYLHRLEKEYDLPVVDTRQWTRDEDFADYCHMATSGVPSYSQRLGREVVQPLIEGKPLSESVLFQEDVTAAR